jgi:two-component system sensor histidine kinase/response regulator
LRSTRFEYAARAITGEWRHLSEHVVAIDAEHDRGFVGTITDVSDLKRAHAQLEKLHHAAEAANRAKSEFLANMSHEIRTPLNGVIGMTSLLLDSSLNGDQREMAAIAHSSGESLLAVLNDVLDFSKIEADQMVLERTDFELRAIVDQAVDSIALRAAEKGLEMIVEVDPSLPAWQSGDPTRLRQVILNLLTNAVKFTEKGEIRIAARALNLTTAATKLRVEVADTGVGLSAKQSGKLFTAFVQADSSTTRRFGGTGLGLSICRRLIELMGGSIGVDSAVGSGSCFWFELPLSPANQPPAPPLPAEFTGINVLVAEDHPECLRIIDNQLSALGCQVTRATTAAECEAAWNGLAASGRIPNIIMLDHSLTGDRGLAVAEKIRRHPEGAKVPIVIMASLGCKSPDAPDGLLMSRVLLKPVKPSALHACLQEVAGRRAPEPAGKVSSIGLGGMRVLIAEDNTVNQKIGRKILEKLGATVSVVENGKAAIDHVLTSQPDVILMDCQMPEMDGYEATRMIRAGAAGSKAMTMPIFALTAHASTEERDRCIAAGMDAHLTKPIDVSALRSMLERIMPDLE